MMENFDLKGLFSRSYEVQDIMTNPPHWILRFGIILGTVIFFSALGLSSFIHMQDSVVVELFWCEDKRSVSVSAPKDGTILSQTIANGQRADSGNTVLSYINTETKQLTHSIAPISGNVSYYKPMFKGCSFHRGEILFSISDTHSAPSDSICYTMLDKGLRKKIDIGMSLTIEQRVNDKKDTIIGRIRSIATCPTTQEKYYTEIVLFCSSQLNIRHHLGDESFRAKVVLKEYTLFDKIRASVGL